MASYMTAKEMNHPDGAKVILVYSVDEEREYLKEFAAWRAAHAEANLAALEGREIKASSTLSLPKRT